MGEHPGRSKSDTYYLTDTELLRTHTSAHQSQHLRQGHEAFLCTGDVYRRDEIDASHFPAFHQMEGLNKYVFDDPDLQTRWRDDYFPFTEPSFELDVFYQDEWLEVLGCGVIHADVLDRCGLASRRGWAFGLGLAAGHGPVCDPGH